MLLALALVLWAPMAEAKPNDAKVEAAINRAMDQYAKDKEVGKANDALLEATFLCDGQCDDELMARAWMYIGLVLGGGNNDWDAARDAFAVALGFDKTVELDPRFFSATGQALFDGLKRQLAEDDPAKVEPGFEAGTQMGCFPLVQEVQTFRPIPIACTTSVANVDRVVLRYRRYGAPDWTRVELQQKGNEWVGQIPCTELSSTGTWGMYVEAKDGRDNPVERIGSRDKPLVFKVVEDTDEPPPALVGQEPPERCSQTTYCPDDMIGTPACDALQGKTSSSEENKVCEEASDCDLGMECIEGACRARDVCTSDADCGDGVCQAGLCAPKVVEPKLDWFGVHFGADFTALAESENVCDGSDGFTCYEGSQTYDGTPFPGNAGTVGGGVHRGTMRAMVSYERFLTPQASLGVRFGFAFSGAPEDFFPMHFEGRGTYYFGTPGRGEGSFTPYLGLGVGLAQVDSRIDVEMVSCRLGRVEQCNQFTEVNQDLLDPEDGAAEIKQLEAYKSLGTVFGNLSPGVMVGLSEKVSVTANVGILLMTERDRASEIILAFQPSLGLAVGL